MAETSVFTPNAPPPPVTVRPARTTVAVDETLVLTANSHLGQAIFGLSP